MNRDLERKIKSYEETYKIYLMYGTPKIIRLDMRAGKSFCKDLKKPFDDIFSQCMIDTMKKLCAAIPGAKLGYTQSDEITIILKDINKGNQEVVFFKNSLTKIISNVASMATLIFNTEWGEQVKKLCGGKITSEFNSEELNELRPYVLNYMVATFDCRYFEVPNIEELKNYCVWRQEDCYRNSINQVARQYFSTEELNRVNTEMKITALEKIGVNLNQFPSKFFKGVVCFRVKETKNGGAERLVWRDFNAPTFHNNYAFINNIYNELIF